MQHSSLLEAMASDAEKEMKKLKDQGGDKGTEKDGNEYEVESSEFDAGNKQKSKRHSTTVWWRLQDLDPKDSTKAENEGVCLWFSQMSGSKSACSQMTRM